MAKVIGIDSALIITGLRARTPSGVFRGNAVARYEWANEWKVEVTGAKSLTPDLLSYAEDVLRAEAAYQREVWRAKEKRDEAVSKLTQPVVEY